MGVIAYSSKTAFHPETVGFVQSAYIRLNVGLPYFAISSSIPLMLAYGTLSASIKTAKRRSFVNSISGLSEVTLVLIKDAMGDNLLMVTYANNCQQKVLKATDSSNE